MGLAALGALHDRLTADEHDPEKVSLAYHEWQRDVLAVYYREAASTDARMGRRMRANLLGESAPANAPAVELPGDHPVTSAQIERAPALDPDLFRTFLRALNLLDGQRRIASLGVVTQVRALADETPAPRPPPHQDGLHDRGTLERLLAPWN